MVNPMFYVGQQIGQHGAKAMRESAAAQRQQQDVSVIDKILKDARDTKDPKVLQDAMGQILTRVSKENQPSAIKFIEDSMKRIDAQEQELKGQQAAREGGYNYYDPAGVQTQQVKDRNKQQYLQQFGIGGQQQQPIEGQSQPAPMQDMGIPQGQPQQQQKRFPEDYSTEELVRLQGAPYKEISEPAKAALQQRQAEQDLLQKKNENWTKFGMERARKVLDRSEEIAESLPIKKTALQLMNNSIATGNLGWWSFNNLAEITGIEGLRDPEGALFKTSGKEYFLGNIKRAGARPNQWIEEQISDMMAKIGRSPEANLSVTRALQNETELEEERVRLTDEIFNKLRNEDKDIGDLGPQLNKKMKLFAEEKQEELFNDLRAIKAISEGKSQKFHKVKEGTPISMYMVQALLKQFGNDPNKASKEAEKLGYRFE